MQAYKINNVGFYIGIEEVEELNEFCITTPINTGYVKPKWDGTEWIEGATAEEIAEWQEQQKPQSSMPNTEQILLEYVTDLDYRLSLKEMGL